MSKKTYLSTTYYRLTKRLILTQRVLVVATKLEQGTIRAGNKQLLVITSALIARTVTQRATSCNHRWYMFLLHWIIQSSIHLSCPRFVSSHPDLYRTLLEITGALIARAVNQREMSCHHRWYLCPPDWMIQSLIHTSYLRFFNSHPYLHITKLMSCKLLQYMVGLHLILQIPGYRCTLRMEVSIFLYSWMMCLSWHRHKKNIMP